MYIWLLLRCKLKYVILEFWIQCQGLKIIVYDDKNYYYFFFFIEYNYYFLDIFIE